MSPMWTHVGMRVGATVNQFDTDSKPIWRFIEAAYQLRKHYDFAENYETLLNTEPDYLGPTLNPNLWNREAYLTLCRSIITDCADDRKPAIITELDGGHY